jgi:hypothetical protein
LKARILAGRSLRSALQTEQLARDPRGGRRQHRREIDRQREEGVQRVAADAMQLIPLAGILRQLPGLRLVEALIDAIRHGHDVAHRFAELARFVGGGDFVGDGQGVARVLAFPGKLTVELP